MLGYEPSCSCIIVVDSYSLDLKVAIAHSHLQGETPRSVAETFKISLSFVDHVAGLYRGSPRARPQIQLVRLFINIPQDIGDNHNRPEC